MADPNSNFPGDILASTFNNYMRSRASDAIFGDIVLWKAIKAKNGVTKKGGAKILEPIMYRKSSAVGFYKGYDLLNITPQEVVTLAEFDWKYAYGTVTISWEEEQKNSGEAEKLNLLKARLHQAETSLADELNEALFLDGTSSDAPIGLALAVDSTGIYGNISRATNSWWAAQETAVSGVLTLGGTTGMRRMYNDVSLGRGRVTPDLLITTQAIYEAYEAMLDPLMRFSNTGAQNAGFAKQNLMFRDASLNWDDYCQSGVLYFLNTDFLGLVEDPSRQASVESGDDRDSGSFRMEPFMKATNQDARTAKFFWTGALVGRNCRHQGKLTGITNA